jgi:hypothetical protein
MKIVTMIQKHVILETALNIAAKRNHAFIAILVAILHNALTTTSQAVLLIKSA